MTTKTWVRGPRSIIDPKHRTHPTFPQECAQVWMATEQHPDAVVVAKLASWQGHHAIELCAQLKRLSFIAEWRLLADYRTWAFYEAWGGPGGVRITLEQIRRTIG